MGSRVSRNPKSECGADGCGRRLALHAGRGRGAQSARTCEGGGSRPARLPRRRSRRVDRVRGPRECARSADTGLQLPATRARRLRRPQCVAGRDAARGADPKGPGRLSSHGRRGKGHPADHRRGRPGFVSAGCRPRRGGARDRHHHDWPRLRGGQRRPPDGSNDGRARPTSG